MIISALLTSVGINLFLCISFFTLYSILRRQPSNFDVYAPRLVAEGKFQRSSGFTLERLLPSTGWLRRAWDLSEDELLSISGLDGVVFMRIFTFSLKMFSFIGLVGVFILLPINYVGNQLTDIDFSDLPNKSLDLFSISNVEDGSKRLWVHFVAVYLTTGVVCYLLYDEYRHISSKRIALFYSSKPQPHQFTILVRGIPISTESSFSDAIERFFAEYHSSTYLSHTMVCRTSKLQGLISDAKKLYKRLMHLKSDVDAQQKYCRSGFLGLFGQKVNLVDHYGKKLEDLEENVRMEQSDISLAPKEVPAAFVSFKSQYGASIALNIQQSDNPTKWVTEQAPEPHDVYWPFFYATFLQRWISKLIVIVASSIITLVFLLPVVFVQGLANLNQLMTWLPFLKGLLTITIVSQVVTGYLPSLILLLFLSIVPPIMKIFSSMQGYISHSEVEISASTKVLWFTIWNIFFANVLSGSVLYQINFFLDFKNIPMMLAIAVPGQLINVYEPKFDTGGKFWPIVHNSTIFSLLLVQAIAVGIFVMKKLPLASSLTLPLLVFTFLFNAYCRTRFLPIFKGYSAESLIKKDREDQRDPAMTDFLKDLVTAYRDPALMPIHYSGNTNDHNTPLLG